MNTFFKRMGCATVIVVFFLSSSLFSQEPQTGIEPDSSSKQPVSICLPIIKGRDEVPLFSYYTEAAWALEEMHHHPSYLHIAIWKDGTIIWTPMEDSDALFEKARKEMPNSLDHQFWYDSPHLPVYIGKISEQKVKDFVNSVSEKDLSVFECGIDYFNRQNTFNQFSTEIVCMFMGNKKLYYFYPAYLQNSRDPDKKTSIEQWTQIKQEALSLIPNEKELAKKSIVLRNLKFNPDYSVSNDRDSGERVINDVDFTCSTEEKTMYDINFACSTDAHADQLFIKGEAKSISSTITEKVLALTDLAEIERLADFAYDCQTLDEFEKALNK